MAKKRGSRGGRGRNGGGAVRFSFFFGCLLREGALSCLGVGRRRLRVGGRLSLHVKLHCLSLNTSPRGAVDRRGAPPPRREA
jgi:hypothetical protein